MHTLSPAAICWPPSSVSTSAVRVNCITGEPWRTNSSIAGMIRASKSSSR